MGKFDTVAGNGPSRKMCDFSKTWPVVTVTMFLLDSAMGYWDGFHLTFGNGSI
jgi:hypothetical protein